MGKKDLNIKSEKRILKVLLKNWFHKIQTHIDNIPKSFKDQIKHLSIIRKDIYEELNQLQHAAAIVASAEKLQSEYQINRWSWHPRQTSHPNEADLTGYFDEKIILNAEITTSLEPKGSIDTHMRTTLKSLNDKDGDRFYFVVADKMYNRANTIITANKYTIILRKL